MIVRSGKSSLLYFSSQMNRKSLSFLYVAPSRRLVVDIKLSPDPQGALWGVVLSQKVYPHPILHSRGHLWEHSSLDNCSYISKTLLSSNRLLLLPNTTRTRVAKPCPDMAELCMLAGVFFNMVQTMKYLGFWGSGQSTMGWSIVAAEVNMRRSWEAPKTQQTWGQQAVIHSSGCSLFTSHLSSHYDRTCITSL